MGFPTEKKLRASYVEPQFLLAPMQKPVVEVVPTRAELGYTTEQEAGRIK